MGAASLLRGAWASAKHGIACIIGISAGFCGKHEACSDFVYVSDGRPLQACSPSGTRAGCAGVRDDGRNWTVRLLRVGLGAVLSATPPVSWALPRACSDGTGLQALGSRDRRRRASPQSMRVRRLCRELALVSCRSRGPILTSYFALCRERCSPPSGCGVRSTSTTSSCRSPSTAPGPRGTRTLTTARGKLSIGVAARGRKHHRRSLRPGLRTTGFRFTQINLLRSCFCGRSDPDTYGL